MSGTDFVFDHFAPFGAPVVRFTGSQGVALGFHIWCLWHSTLCEQLAQSEFRSNSNCRAPGTTFSPDGLEQNGSFWDQSDFMLLRSPAQDFNPNKSLPETPFAAR